MSKIDVRLANEAWEALFRAQMGVARVMRESDIWDGLLENEYNVLHTLSQAPEGMRMIDLKADVLITKAGLSRLIARMEERGLIAREPDPDDGRASRLRLTEAGIEKQRRIGMAHVRQIADELGRRLDADQLVAIRDSCSALVQRMGATGAAGSPVDTPSNPRVKAPKLIDFAS